MQKVFNSLYQGLIALFYSRKPVDFGLYKTEVFNSVGWFTLLAAVTLVLVFYYLFNKAFRSGMSRPIHWFWVLLLAAGSGAAIALRVSLTQGAAPDSYLQFFIIVNALVGAVWFLLLSALLKKGSDYARTTPFTGPF